MAQGRPAGPPTPAIPGYGQAQLIHESGPRAIYRAVREADGETVILKTLHGQYPRQGHVAEIRREFQLARKLAIDGVVRVHSLVTHGSGNLAIEMEPFGRSLAELIAERAGRSLPLDRFFAIAVRLAQILGRLHEQGVVHKDIVPRNVLYDPASGELRLIDFGISSELSREHQSAALSRRLQGSLPYISPEQTGRMNRDLDYRSDYYSLGVTFFELLTGRLPFAAENALEWMHRHISQPPPAAHTVNPGVPEPLSRIVTKLMAKDAEDRYQSTYGLIADLERCRDELARFGSVADFELGRADVSRRFQIPQKLYGREAELEQLRSLFGNVVRGATELCLVTGYSGVGKSALVSELGKSIAAEQGYMIQGKFDQFQESSAYGAIAAAFRDLMQQLLGEPKSRLDAWRDALKEALGPSGQLIVELVPELELVIGAQPPVAELPPTEAQNRFQIVFLSFVSVFANERQPLVVFLDDLQWSDVPTLNLIHRLVTARELRHLLVVGAYRSNVVGAGHPLRLTLDQIQKTRHLVEVPLQPLPRSAVDRLVADTLHGEIQTCEPLSALIYDKAQGNPFFINELLKRLCEEGAIFFDPDAGHWNWDLDAVRQADVSDNVVDFMVANLRRLRRATQQVLQLAACIGNGFDLRTLSIIYERSMAKTSAALHEALNRNMVVPLSESYRFAGLDTADDGADDADAVNPIYRFQHDRVQQAAYALIDADRKQAVHLSIGRLIQRHSSTQEVEERLTDIVGHLNAGRTLIEDPRERRELACMNLEAGLKAQRSSAYASALGFLTIGQELLQDDAWERDAELMLALSREVQQCCYLTGDYAGADAWTETLLERARTPLHTAQALSARTRQYATIGRMRESIQAAVAGLSLLGVELVEEPGPETLVAEIADVERNLAGRQIAELIDAPAVTDPDAQVASRLLMEIFPAAFLSGSGNLFPYLVLKSVNLSLRHGASPEAAFAYAAYGMLLCGALNDPATGYQYGRLAVAMNERFDDLALKSRTIYVYAMFIHHWSNHWSTMTPWFLKGIEAGYQSGDLLYLAYSAQDCIIWDPRLDLETASREQRKYLSIVRDCEYQDSLDSGTLFLQMQLNFQGRTTSLYAMNDESFDEERCVEGMRARRFMTGIANYHIYKAEIHYFYDDCRGALEHVRAQDELIASSMSLPQLVRFYVVAFLTRAALYHDMSRTEQAATLDRLQADLRQMSLWAGNCPDNFEHLRLVMQAELARLADRLAEALVLYERAIAAAKASGFQRDEAQANELVGKYLRALEMPKAAEGYLRAAWYLYYRWGAHRKVEDLKQKYPELFDAPARTPSSGTTALTLDPATKSLDMDSLDMSSVIKASQTISGEIVLDQLWKTTMQILLENAGAQRGCFVVHQDDQLVIQAQVEAGRVASTLVEPLPAPAPEEAPALPVSVIHNVLRTGKALVLNDASAPGRFAADPYIVRHKPKSVICIPVLRHAQFAGAIYMENNLTTGAFTEERVEVIKLLSAQASISMENARLYEGQMRLIEAQQRFVPRQFLESLGHHDIARVGLGEYVAREMSVMFADLREFTPLAERLGPRTLIEILNRYFSRLGAPIAAAGGFIDAYRGDEIMALFGLPVERALAAGIGMWRTLDEFNRESSASGGPSLDMGLGVNAGPLVLGTVGSHDRLQCGVVGDTVNLASRIERLTRVYRARFLLGEQAFASLSEPGSWSIRRVDRVAVKGKEQPIQLYEVLDVETPGRRAAKEATRDRLERGMELYYGREFAKAHEVFTAAAALDPDDAVLSIFAHRSDRFAREAPSPDWQGFETLTQQ